MTAGRNTPEMVSFCLTVYNSVATIERTLRSLKCRYPSETVVVDNCSTDGTYEAIQSLGIANLRAVREKTSRGEGRNTAIRKARGDVIVMVDGDVEYTGIEDYIDKFISFNTRSIVFFSHFGRAAEDKVHLTMGWKDTYESVGLYGSLQCGEDTYFQRVTEGLGLFKLSREELPFRTIQIKGMGSGSDRRYSTRWRESLRRRFQVNRDILFINNFGFAEFRRFLRLDRRSELPVALAEYLLARMVQFTVHEEKPEHRVRRLLNEQQRAVAAEAKP